MALQFQSGVVVLVVVALGCASPCLGQTQQPARVPAPEHPAIPSLEEKRPDPLQSGSISGIVLDASGAVVAGARVKLTGQNQSPGQEVLSDANGQFSFLNVAPGPCQLTTSSPGFAERISSVNLHAGENYAVPQIILEVATASTEVQVGLSPIEVAQEQIEDQEKQRVLGFIPNFYVSYEPHPVPLTSKRKFELAWKMTVDPVNLVIIGGIAGVQQWQDDFSGYGQGAQGYAKRYGAAFAGSVTSTFIGGAILPSLLKQDPRYFYKGIGSPRSRILYAMASPVICKGDNGRWQPNYSNVVGNLAAGGISNLYYPSRDRNGVGLTFENGLIGLGAGAAANLFQEFLVRKLTPHIPKHAPKS
jgi:hypothetical protein